MALGMKRPSFDPPPGGFQVAYPAYPIGSFDLRKLVGTEDGLPPIEAFGNVALARPSMHIEARMQAVDRWPVDFMSVEIAQAAKSLNQVERSPQERRDAYYVLEVCHQRLRRMQDRTTFEGIPLSPVWTAQNYQPSTSDPGPSERGDLLPWLRGVLYGPQAVVFLDTETTDLTEHAQAVSIAVKALDGTPLFYSLVRPTVAIDPEAIKIHGITDAMVDEAPTFREVWADLYRVLGVGRPVVFAYSADFDRRILFQSALACRMPSPAAEADWKCAASVYQTFMANEKFKKLGEAAQAMGVDLDDPHHALADCEAAREVVLAMAGASRLPPLGPGEILVQKIGGTLVAWDSMGQIPGDTKTNGMVLASLTEKGRNRLDQGFQVRVPLPVGVPRPIPA